jgi:hypothetical protein
VFRILFGALVLLAITSGPVQTQAPTVDQESLAGFWETSENGSIDGFFLSFAFLTVRVYHRIPDPESRSGYPTLKDFDGRRLAVAGFDVTFDPGRRRWNGTLTRAGQTRQVGLERPRPGPGVSIHPLAGDWAAEQDPTEILKQAGSLHVSQSYDGTVNAWLNRLLAPFDEQRYGELLDVSTENGEVRLRLTQYLTGPPLEYRGTVSPDGSRITGGWVRPGFKIERLDGRRLQDTWKLNAPTIFVRQP